MNKEILISALCAGLLMGMNAAQAEPTGERVNAYLDRKGDRIERHFSR